VSTDDTSERLHDAVGNATQELGGVAACHLAVKRLRSDVIRKVFVLG
jgi:hypothetical protein